MAIRRVDLGRLLRPYWLFLAVAFAATLVEGGADLLEPWPLKIVFDNVLGSKPIPGWLAASPLHATNRVRVLDLAAVALVAIAAIGAASAYVEDYLSVAVAKRVGYQLRQTLFGHIERLSLSFHDRHPVGDLVVRLTSDIDSVESFIASAALGILLDLIMLVGMTIVMFRIAGIFAAAALAVAPLLFVMVFRHTRRIKHASREVKRQESELASLVHESISLVRVVKAFAQEDAEEGRLARCGQAMVDRTLEARSLKARLSPQVNVLVAVSTCLALWGGARLVLADRLTAGALLVFVLYLGRMYKPMKNMSKTSESVSKAAIGLERIGEVLAIESQVRDSPWARPASRVRGHIALSHVGFGYEPGWPVLRSIDLVVEPGQRAAIVGVTGAGKSTLLSLIPRLYACSSGRIAIDGRDVRDYTLDSLRRQVSMVPQDTALFRTTIAHNIAYGRPDATRSGIVRAAELANADEFILRMPDGYDSIVGERGETLSGGQRQRIALARAIIRDAPILLLDEPYAALDAESESLVREALSRVTAGRTSIMVSHRLSSVRDADVSFVLHGGVIAERGTHDQLLARNGVYARLCRMQEVGVGEHAVAMIS